MENQEKNIREASKVQDINNHDTAKTEEQSKKEQEKESIKTAQTLKKDLVEIKIPIDPLNKTDKTVDVIINGYRWTIERGKEVKVPRAVKELLADAQYI